MRRPISGLSMVNQMAMLVAEGPCVFMSYLSFLSCDQDLCFQGILFLAERASQLRQRNVLKLTNSFPGNTEILTNILQSLWLSAVETETLRDDFLLPVVEHVEQPLHFVAQVLVAQQFKRSLRLLVADHLAEFGRIIIHHRGIKRSRTDTNTPQPRDFFAGDTEFFAKFVVGRFAAEIIAHLERNTAHLREFIDQMHG